MLQGKFLSPILPISLVGLVLSVPGRAEEEGALLSAPSPSCTHPGFPDGCASATPGKPNFPDLLTAYGANRPPWDVAGVDYAVGVEEGSPAKRGAEGSPTKQGTLPPPLLDPSVGPWPTGCSFKSPTLTCSGQGLVVKGFDFSLHGGMKLSLSGSDFTVSGNLFALAPNCSDPSLRSSGLGGANLISHNTFDGGGATCRNLSIGGMVFITLAAGASLEGSYNLFLDTPQDAWDFAGPRTGNAKLTIRYNLFYKEGWVGHPDGFQTCGGNFSPIILNWNTYYTGGNTVQAQPLHVEAQCTAAIGVVQVEHNTISVPGTCNGGRNWPNGCFANFGIACKQDPGANTLANFTASTNYIDASGMISALTNAYKCPKTSWSGNINMLNGSVIPSP